MAIQVDIQTLIIENDWANWMPLSSTQIGAIGENLLVNAVMKASDGRLSPFQPLADDDGLDVLFFDKLTGNSAAIQLKCRREALFKPGTKERGNSVHFEVRKSTFNDARRAYLVAALFNEEMTHFIATWFMPLALLPHVARNSADKWVIRASKATNTADRFITYRCLTDHELALRIIAICETGMPTVVEPN